jgi:uncharacterized LabA/DUF88 family protein
LRFPRSELHGGDPLPTNWSTTIDAFLRRVPEASRRELLEPSIPDAALDDLIKKYPPPGDGKRSRVLLRKYLASRAATDAMAARGCLKAILPLGFEPDAAPLDADATATLARLWSKGDHAPAIAAVLALVVREGDDVAPALQRLLDALRDGVAEVVPAPAAPAVAAVPLDEHEAALRALGADLKETRRVEGELRRRVRELEADLHREKARAPATTVSPEEEARRQRELRKVTHDAALLPAERKARSEAEARVTTLEHDVQSARASLEKAAVREADLLAERESLRHRIDELEKRLAAGPMKKARPQRSAERVGIYVDVSNLYYAAVDTLGGTVDYRRIRETLEAGRRVVRAVAFLVDSEENLNQGFKSAIQDQGFQLQVRRLVRRGDGSAKGNWDIGMALQIKEDVQRLDLDTVVLASGDGDFVDLFQELKPLGIRLEVLGVPGSIAHRLREAADVVYEMDKDWVYRQRERSTFPKAPPANR